LVNAYPRESVEFQPVKITRDGVEVINDLGFAIVPDGERPEDFVAGVFVEGKIGIMIQDLERGTYRIFAQLTSTPEIPVIDCGYFYIT
jgi:hypothetical protein